MPPHPDPMGRNFISIEHHDTYPAIAQSNHQGRTVLITGASKGIGRATAISFAKSGVANIIIAARSSLEEVEKSILSAVPSSSSPPQILKLQLDITSESSVSSAATTVKDKFGHLDVLVNNAGYLEEWNRIAESDPIEWWKSWDVNIKGVYLMTRAFLPLLLLGNSKTIVNVSSIGGHNIRHGASAYQGTKFALFRFTEFTSVEYSDQGIIAFAIHPGAVPTELAMNMPDHLHSLLIDKPELAADTIAWLTQDRKEWLSGRYVSVCWDMPEFISKQEEILEGDKLKMRIVV
jgi:NAD(P)-dependent dehydrogenase (short-subunit alcohol dehydrogenase family)